MSENKPAGPSPLQQIKAKYGTASNEYWEHLLVSSEPDYVLPEGIQGPKDGSTAARKESTLQRIKDQFGVGGKTYQDYLHHRKAPEGLAAAAKPEAPERPSIASQVAAFCSPSDSEPAPAPAEAVQSLKMPTGFVEALQEFARSELEKGRDRRRGGNMGLAALSGGETA